jgi:nucleolar complex protein 2
LVEGQVSIKNFLSLQPEPSAMARGRTTKSTKKFESKHLSRTIESRKIQKKNRDKYNKRNPGHDARKSGARANVEEEAVKKKAAGKGPLIEGMTMDEFLDGGAAEDTQVDPDVTEDLETEVENLEMSHKAGLEGLKDNDPSFYEFLKQNDKELLEFEPDELIEEDVEEGPMEGGLTVEILSKWEKLLIEEKSLGTLKKVLIAVRSAAASVIGEEEKGNAKYVLMDPEGLFALHLMLM